MIELLTCLLTRRSSSENLHEIASTKRLATDGIHSMDTCKQRTSCTLLCLRRYIIIPGLLLPWILLCAPHQSFRCGPAADLVRCFSRWPSGPMSNMCMVFSSRIEIHSTRSLHPHTHFNSQRPGAPGPASTPTVRPYPESTASV